MARGKRRTTGAGAHRSPRLGGATLRGTRLTVGGHAFAGHSGKGEGPATPAFMSTLLPPHTQVLSSEVGIDVDSRCTARPTLEEKVDEHHLATRLGANCARGMWTIEDSCSPGHQGASGCVLARVHHPGRRPGTGPRPSRPGGVPGCTPGGSYSAGKAAAESGPGASRGIGAGSLYARWLAGTAPTRNHRRLPGSQAASAVRGICGGHQARRAPASARAGTGLNAREPPPATHIQGLSLGGRAPRCP